MKDYYRNSNNWLKTLKVKGQRIGPVWLLSLMATALSASLASSQAFASQSTFTDTQTTDAQTGPQKYPQFAGATNDSPYRFDFSSWNAAVNRMVVDFGAPDRVGLAAPPPRAGTRLVEGHTSKYRLEGNRIPFSLLDDKAKAVLTLLREDLEAAGNQVPLNQFNRNSQLAFWINLHNAIVIEQIALNYPVKRPEEILIGPEKVPLEDAKLTTIQGQSLSLRDIREEIVYRNFQDANSIYGFFRGTIGGPSIQTSAYTGDNVEQLLKNNAKEFVNSLRGVSKWGKTITTSKIYDEAMPLFKSWPEDLISHLATHSEGYVAAVLKRPFPVATTTYEPTVADMVAGRPIEGFKSPRDVVVQESLRATRIGGDANFNANASTIEKLLSEVNEKHERLQMRVRRKQIFQRLFKRRAETITVEEVEPAEDS